MKRNSEIGDHSKQVLSKPSERFYRSSPAFVLSNPTRFYRTPIWHTKRFYTTRVKSLQNHRRPCALFKLGFQNFPDHSTDLLFEVPTPWQCSVILLLGFHFYCDVGCSSLTESTEYRGLFQNTSILAIINRAEGSQRSKGEFREETYETWIEGDLLAKFHSLFLQGWALLLTACG